MFFFGIYLGGLLCGPMMLAILNAAERTGDKDRTRCPRLVVWAIWPLVVGVALCSLVRVVLAFIFLPRNLRGDTQPSAANARHAQEPVA